MIFMYENYEIKIKIFRILPHSHPQKYQLDAVSSRRSQEWMRLSTLLSNQLAQYCPPHTAPNIFQLCLLLLLKSNHMTNFKSNWHENITWINILIRSHLLCLDQKNDIGITELFMRELEYIFSGFLHKLGMVGLGAKSSPPIPSLFKHGNIRSQ